MDRPERLIFVFGLYLILIGLGLMVVPSAILDVFRLQYGDDAWTRFVGLLASVIGVYYVAAAKGNVRPMFIWTVWMRYYAAAFMTVLFFSGRLGPAILVFAAIDAAGATATLLSLRKRGPV